MSSTLGPRRRKRASDAAPSKHRKRNEEDEERDLESRLFGSRKPQREALLDDALSSDDEETGLGWMQDNELFTVDIPGDVSEDDLEPPTMEFPEEDEVPSVAKKAGSVWSDPADDAVVVSLQENKRLRKLKKKASNTSETADGKELQAKLRAQFEQLHPKPEWASRRLEGAVPSIHRLLNSTTSLIAKPEAKRSPLEPGFLDIQRLRNANEQNPTTGKKQASNAGFGVVDLAWHPSPRVPVLAVAGGDRRVRFFNIDGHTNAPLLTLNIPSLPLKRATFHPSGSSVLLTGSRPFYYTYDLAAQTCIRSPRNLFGSSPTPSSPQSLDRHAFSPDGSLLAVAGRRGCVSVVEWRSGGSNGVVVGELRSGRGGTVADLTWSDDGSQLNVLGGANGDEVEVWDIAERNVVRQWKDDRAFGGLVMRNSSEYTAIGSTTGIVNLYRNASLAGRKQQGNAVESFKSLEHLTTPISSIAFHPSQEIIASASGAKTDLLKLYHLPSGTAFSNWPTSSTPLGRVNSVKFSPGGEYLTTGNTKGAVLLWSLRHFAVDE
ncbi:U3 snoRNP protein [Vanrija albida]|uniref:U3 snoRNP protein n=1 Tax=Vanrija albida TaxID=181172 RepID=A0ABR3PXL9_9TREE